MRIRHGDLQGAGGNGRFFCVAIDRTTDRPRRTPEQFRQLIALRTIIPSQQLPMAVGIGREVQQIAKVASEARQQVRNRQTPGRSCGVLPTQRVQMLPQVAHIQNGEAAGRTCRQRMNRPARNSSQPFRTEATVTIEQRRSHDVPVCTAIAQCLFAVERMNRLRADASTPSAET